MRKVGIVVLTIAIVGLVIRVAPCLLSFNDTEYIIKVTGKERVTDSSKYLVLGDDLDGNSLVFENTDNLFRGKFNSSNIQGQLKMGYTYKLTVVGYRIPFFSWYENIISVAEVEE